MAEPIAPTIEPSLINQAPTTIAELNKETILYPDKVVEAPKPPETTTPVVLEVKKEEPKEPAPATTETKPAPVDYETLKLPEGSLLSQQELAEVKKDAKENNLSLEEAQGIIEVKNDAIKGFSQRQQETWQNLRKEWKQSWLNDPEYGGDKASESTELAKRAWDKLADNELKTLADQTGWGDHPAVLRMLARAGRLFSEDQLIRGNVVASPQKQRPEEILYGKTSPSNEQPMV